VFISQLKLQLLYLPGLKNVIADFLSAHPYSPLDQSPRRRQTQWITKRWPPSKTVARKRSACWVAHPSNWLSARHAFRKDIFLHFHNVLIPGALPPIVFILSRFVWCGSSSDITTWTRECLACHQGNIHCHTRLAPQPIPIPQRRFSHLHVDLVGPLQYSKNLIYIFTIIDRTSIWIEAIPLSDTSTAACTKALTFPWIASLWIAARNLLQTFGLNFARCLTSPTDKQPLTILNRTGHSKGCTAASRTPFAHAPPRRLGPMSYLLCSSDYRHIGCPLIFASKQI
jgi:hypothetical protein